MCLHEERNVIVENRVTIMEIIQNGCILEVHFFAIRKGDYQI